MKLQKSPVAQLLKNFTFYRNRRFITMFTSARHRSLSWAKWIQSITPHPIHLRSILILSSYLRLDIRSDLWPSGFPTKTLCAFLFSPCMLHALEVPILILNWFRNERCKFWSLFLQNHLNDFAEEIQCMDRRSASWFEVANEWTKHKNNKRMRVTHAVEKRYFLVIFILRKRHNSFSICKFPPPPTHLHSVPCVPLLF
jgi:hypothetical protein